MDWNNIDLDSQYEREQEILDGYDFETLLLEIGCNLKEINKETVREHFEQELRSKVRSAKKVFNANLDSIVRKAQQERRSD